MVRKGTNQTTQKLTILERGPSNMIIHTGKHKTTQYIIHLPHQYIRKTSFLFTIHPSFHHLETKYTPTEVDIIVKVVPGLIQ